MFPFSDFWNWKIFVSIKSIRNSRLQMFFKLGVLKTFANFTGKHVLDSLMNKVAGGNFKKGAFL